MQRKPSTFIKVYTMHDGVHFFSPLCRVPTTKLHNFTLNNIYNTKFKQSCS